VALNSLLFFLRIATSVPVRIARVIPNTAWEQDLEGSKIANDACDASFDGGPEVQPGDLGLAVLFVCEDNPDDGEENDDSA